MKVRRAKGRGGGRVVYHKVTTRMNELANELCKYIGGSVAEGKNGQCSSLGLKKVKTI